MLELGKIWGIPSRSRPLNPLKQIPVRIRHPLSSQWFCTLWDEYMWNTTAKARSSWRTRLFSSSRINCSKCHSLNKEPVAKAFPDKWPKQSSLSLHSNFPMTLPGKTLRNPWRKGICFRLNPCSFRTREGRISICRILFSVDNNPANVISIHIFLLGF